MDHVRVENSTDQAIPVNIVAGGAGDGNILDGVDTAIKASVKDLANSNPLTVAIVDGSGDQITSFGGGTQYADGAARGTATGTLMIGDDGTNVQAVSVDSTGKLNVNNISGTVSLPTGASTSAKQDTLIAAVDGLEALYTDVIAFETTTNLASAATYSSGLLQLSPQYSQVLTNILSDRTGTMNVYWYSDVGGTDLVRTLTVAYTGGDGFESFGAPAFTRSVKYEFTNSAGASTTDFYFTTKFLVKPISPQTATLSAPLGSGMVGAVTRSVLVGLNSSGGGSYVNVKVNPSGTLETNTTLAAGTNNIGDVDILSIAAGDNNIGNVDIVTMPNVTLAAGTNTNEVVGDVADAVAAAGNPVSMGFTARTTNRTAVADGQAVRAAADDMGRALVVIGQPRDLIGQQHTQIASSAAETTIITAVASTFCDLVELVITNQTATAVNVTIKDSTAGTTRMIIALAASGGAVIPFTRPIPQATVNNNWTATLSSAAVTVNIFALFERNV